MKTSVAGINLIKHFEGFRAEPYKDGGGVWTIGYGTTHNVSHDTPHVSEEHATQLLAEDLAKAEHQIETFIKVPLNQHQFDALASLTYNCGPNPLKMTLGKLLNHAAYEGAADQFPLWCHDNGRIVEGLVRRRKAERGIFLGADYAIT